MDTSNDATNIPTISTPGDFLCHTTNNMYPFPGLIDYIEVLQTAGSLKANYLNMHAVILRFKLLYTV